MAHISTHTPAWGVTAVKGVYADNFGISTHTPAWGVTKTPYAAKQWYNDFNSHARVGRDGGLQKLNRRGCKFQLTRPRGA